MIGIFSLVAAGQTEDSTH